MNERPDQNRRTSGEPRATGSFKVNIDQRDLMTGSVEPPDRRSRRQEPYGEPPASARAYLTEEERKQEKKAHRKRNRIKARKNKRIFAFMWLCMVLLTAFTLASYLISGSNDFFAIGRNEGTTQVEIPESGMDIDALAEILAQSGAIDKPEFFSLYCKVKKEEPKYFVPGVHHVETNLDYEDLINTLQTRQGTHGDEVSVTIPEGYNALEIAQLLEEKNVCTGQEFLDALNNKDFSNYEVIAAMNSEGRYYKLEGYLFPDTYNFYEGEELESVIGKMINNFQNRISSQTWNMGEERGMTKDQVVILASIIQAEAADTSDMFNVSSVLHNRLDFGAEYDIYRLECDSTMHYPYRNAGAIPESGALPNAGYSTYELDGLPPGPICNPGAEAILAAVRPNESSYLYFCHADDGTAYYATNSWEHEENLYAAGLMD